MIGTPVINQQVSSLNCLEWLTRKCTTNGSKYVEIRDPFSIQLFVYTSVWILYTNCIHNVHDVHNLYIRIDVHKMLVYKMYLTFRQAFVYVLCTKFSWLSSFDFVYKMYRKVCRNVGYILYLKLLKAYDALIIFSKFSTFGNLVKYLEFMTTW